MRILALSILDQEQYIFQILHAGTRSYVLKSARIEELVLGIRRVAAGDHFLCIDAGLAALRKLREGLQAPTGVATSALGALSKRELEVLDGSTTNELTSKLLLSKRTIETHRQNMMEKTQVKNTAALIRVAMSEGLAS